MTVQFSRRDFGRLLGLAGAAVALPAGRAAAATRTWRVAGQAYAGLTSFDTTMKTFMQARNVTSGSLAVTRAGKLVLARGYTWSADTGVSTQPTSLFRTASITKPVTATAVLRLVQDGRLKLTDRLTDLLGLSASADARLADVTLLRLLQHLGGWDRDISGDPLSEDLTIATALGKQLPISQDDIIAYVTARPLDHTPGTAYAYSNYGYLLLGKIIERVTGTAYATYTQNTVLTPLQISRMRLGRTLTPATGEVAYYSQYRYKTVMDASGTVVDAPYGSFNYENHAFNGGWLASAVDLTRFATIYDGKTSVLNTASVSRAFAQPETGINADGWYYGCGWMVRPVTGGTNTWHDGSLPGTSTLLVRRYDGLSWAVMFDQRDDASGKSYGDIDPALHTAADAVTAWPTGDLSGSYF